MRIMRTEGDSSIWLRRNKNDGIREIYDRSTGGEIIARGHNLRNTDKNPLRHAEIDVIDAAAKIVGDWRLEDCVLYVTVEPCPMCAGAIVQARIPRVVFGTRNSKAGCAGSEGVLQPQCSEIMKRFFKRFRKNANAAPLTENQ